MVVEGHNCKLPKFQHSYFGSENVVEELTSHFTKNLYNGSIITNNSNNNIPVNNGYWELKKEDQFVRDNSGLVTGLKFANDHAYVNGNSMTM
jgi:hypothetical protein